MRKFIAGLLVGVMLTMAIPAFAANAIRLIVNGQEVSPEIPPMMVKGTTMVPLRFVAETFGADVEWDSSSNTIKLWQSREQALWLDLLQSTMDAVYNWKDACRWSNYLVYTDAAYDRYQNDIKELMNKLRTAPFDKEFQDSQIDMLTDLSIELVDAKARAHSLK